MIGLVPYNMQLPLIDSFMEQCKQSLESVLNIIKTLGCEKDDCLGCVCFVTNSGYIKAARQYFEFCFQKCPVLFIVVERLPKDALVEWAFTWSTLNGYHNFLKQDPDIDPALNISCTMMKQNFKKIEMDGLSVITQSRGFSSFSLILAKLDNFNMIFNDLNGDVKLDVLAVKIYHLDSIDGYSLQSNLLKIFSEYGFEPAIATVPVNEIEDSYDIAISLISFQ
jgi:hypothetical protein